MASPAARVAIDSNIELTRSPSARRNYGRSPSMRIIKKRFPGVFGITYRNWGYILLVFCVLYSGFLLYFLGLLQVALEVRDDRYLVLPKTFYGPFVKDVWPAYPKIYTSYPRGYQVPWNSTLY
ncbi:hypothetical protein KFL_004870090 [Klebsormidium nitens]|uniref:Uncharacterized protein n=1 Tax=Klebsormidium nitens TaxID=105231 RepID=A0A1Y1IDS1_KLENI|nr:hypothetical protein KFL_004870090 [Klebsormidium nitens]|eukprot:GAQ89104.1 hypothetical protein KFL_004870090 [Klebsormidium nitens]